jgi:hypothetical protein
VSRGPQKVRQNAVARSVKGVVKGGVEVERVEIDKDGKITVIARKAVTAEDTLSADDELTRWREK